MTTKVFELYVYKNILEYIKRQRKTMDVERKHRKLKVYNGTTKSLFILLCIIAHSTDI